MSGQHASFEEESHGEPSSQIGSGDVPGQKLQAGSLGAATSTTHYLDRVRAVLALLSLIFGFVLVLVVIASKSPSFIDFIFVILFGILAIPRDAQRGRPLKNSPLTILQNTIRCGML